MITELKVYIPVVVTSKNNAAGYAFALIDYGQEHNILWGTIINDTGEVWWVSNKDIRVDNNWSLGRVKK